MEGKRQEAVFEIMMPDDEQSDQYNEDGETYRQHHVS